LPTLRLRNGEGTQWLVVIAGHSRSKNGVASLAYDPAIHTASSLAEFIPPFDSLRVAWTTGSSPVVTTKRTGHGEMLARFAGPMKFLRL
jgi:hypothetical protein